MGFRLIMRIRQYAMRRRLKKRLQPRSAAFLGLSQVRSAVVVFDQPLPEPETMERIKAVFDRCLSGCETVEYVFFESCRMKGSVLPAWATAVRYRQLNWALVPVSSDFERIAAFRYDLLVDMSSMSIPSDYFVRLSRSRFKIGRSETVCDLCVNYPEQASCDAMLPYAEALCGCLSSINNPK